MGYRENQNTNVYWVSFCGLLKLFEIKSKLQNINSITFPIFSNYSGGTASDLRT